ncbi:phytoene/squalene synthase family protein [Bryobacter aggregatus]|uniref:phytoene/squalene synthase family protein n=1 Tax=Bryobacter aggregatus TaxID=360054 RepID=UPI00055B3720|nr:phytoene/squalene synthase family protein [Bryobacter aggregatus]
MISLSDSYDYCVQIARSRAKNFYYSFLVLPKPKRQAMCAVYAFMRECDDLSDEAGATRGALDRWREDLDRALDGDLPAHRIWPAFADTVNRYQIPRAYLYDMIEGVTSDLSFTQPPSFDDLYRYCYRVASVVGLTITHIFGFEQPRTLEMAEKCGIAFQLTNIIRDVGEDSGLGRCYLPLDLMEKYGVTPADLQQRSVSEPLRLLLRDLGSRARAYYDFSRPMIGLVGKDSRGSLWALIEIYSRLFARIEASNFEVLAARHRLPTIEKLWIVVRATLPTSG